MRKIIFLLSLVSLFLACNKTVQNSYEISLKELTDDEYPDNPDIKLRHPNFGERTYEDIQLKLGTDSLWTINLIPKGHHDTISISKLSLDEFMPRACEMVKGDDYLTHIAIINQEWNRQQVKFLKGDFIIKTIKGEVSHDITRVDIARNCLNAYLWEVIIYANDPSGKEMQIHHSWFDFPKDLYGVLFEKVNQLPYDKYSASMEEWVRPENKTIDFSKLRTVTSEKEVKFENLNHLNFPLKGERAKKHQNIVNPKNTTKIQDYLTDKTLFATFSPPGFYTTQDPRKTELSRLANPTKTILRKLDNDLVEIEVVYTHKDQEKATKLILSGLDLKSIPTLDTADVNNGWQNSMGFGNHTFYSTYAYTVANPSNPSKYFCVLTNHDNEWLDSHEVGIDGPMLHFDKNDLTKLHLWILSFERHSFVGHYVIDLK